MPIIVVCPNCGTKLSAPDAAAGKRVKCPKADCGTTVPVPASAAAPAPLPPPTPLPAPPPVPPAARAPAPPPAPAQSTNAFDFDDDEPKPSKKPARKSEPDEDEDEDRPAKKKRAAAEDEEEARPRMKRRAVDDDDDDEDDRPTRRRKQPASGLSPVVIGAIALGGLLVLGGIGYGIYALTKKSDDTASSGSGSGTPEKPKGKAPETWVEYKSTQDKFKMMMPKQTKPISKGNNSRRHSAETEEDMMALVYVIDIPPKISAAQRKEMEDSILGKKWSDDEGKEVSRQQIRFAGQNATEIVADLKEEQNKKGQTGKPRVFIRIFSTEKKVYMVSVGCFQGESGQPAVAAVFDTFQLLP